MIAWLLAACGPPGPAAADACAGCHADQHDAWSLSAHARGGSPILEAWRPEVRAAWGEAAEARCVACHAPGFVEGEAIGCATCHGAVGNRAERDGALVVALDRGWSGRSGDGAPHGVVDRPLLRASALCATCHEVTGPGLLVETTGSEHRAWGGPDGCADCHLRGHAFDPLRGEGLTLAVERDGDALVVSLGNTGAGHAVPSGPAVLRDTWVDLPFAPRVLEIGPVPVAGGARVALLTEADGTAGRSLAPGEWRQVRVPIPPGTPARDLRATLWTARAREEAAAALGLAEGVRDVREVATVRP